MMTLTLTREDFAHMTRRRQRENGQWETVCSCGWTSEAAGHPDLLGYVCGQRRRELLYGPTVTPESLAAVRATVIMERRECERLTGCRILEDGMVIHPSNHKEIG